MKKGILDFSKEKSKVPLGKKLNSRKGELMRSEFTQLDTPKFLLVLSELYQSGVWTPCVEKRLLRLKRQGSYNLYCPLTAVYHHLTGIEIMNCFWVPEMTELFHFPWWEVLEISFATDACDCGRQYDRVLRSRILTALQLPPENLNH